MTNTFVIDCEIIEDDPVVVRSRLHHELAYIQQFLDHTGYTETSGHDEYELQQAWFGNQENEEEVMETDDEDQDRI